MTTPARRQYLRIKQQYPDALLLFRMGDFYETFDEDAKVVARELDITLTSREMGSGQRFPLAGIPYHALDTYLARLITKGYKVAICEQTSDPATSKGLVDRAVVRVVTPERWWSLRCCRSAPTTTWPPWWWMASKPAWPTPTSAPATR